MGKVPVITLKNGVEMPQLGLGMMNETTQEEMDAAVSAALEAGYTSFDTAYVYGNEKELGHSLNKYAKDRKDLFITNKSRMLRHSYQDTIDTVYRQLESLQTNYFDLYLIHWPLPVKPELYIEAWHALEKLYKDGIIRALGVSNFFVKHLKRLMEECEVEPMVNQIQGHPYYVNHEVVAFCKEHNIQMESWQPFGAGVLLSDETICGIGREHGKSAAQIILRWQMQKGFAAIPGPIEPEFIKENIEIFDFELSDEEMERIDAMECQKPIMLDVCKGVYDPDEFPLMW